MPAALSFFRDLPVAKGWVPIMWLVAWIFLGLWYFFRRHRRHRLRRVTGTLVQTER